MTESKGRADALLENWLTATARPVPAFVPYASRRRPRVTVFVVVAVIVAGTVVGGLVIGGVLDRSREPIPPAELPATVIHAIATAPGIEYSLAISSRQGSGDLGLGSTGRIDLQHGRFSGTADSGAAPFMLLFGGPKSGAAVVADGLYVQTEGGPWERIAVRNPALDHLMDPIWLSTAVDRWMGSSRIDPAVRFAPCGQGTCQIVTVAVPPAALYRLAADLMGADVGTPPPDLGPIDVELSIDRSGFPVQVTTQVTAGPTTTALTLDLVRLDPAPSITPPIP